MSHPNILIVHDKVALHDEGLLESAFQLKAWLQRCEVSTNAQNGLGESRPDVVLLVTSKSCAPGEMVAKSRREWSGVPIIAFLHGHEAMSEEVRDCLVNEVDDYIVSPVTEVDVQTRLARLLRRHGAVLAKADSSLLPSSHFGLLIGDDPVFLTAVHKIPLLAASDAPVLIYGETGTGKELFARAIHYTSPRGAFPFVPVNCSALPEHLFENELFGHARGAYTDASGPTEGLIAEAEGGTLFLDEIDTLSPSGQAKVLRFVQNREYRMLGSPKTLHANVRILVATNADLGALVARQQFRQDLYYRLTVFQLPIPALRERMSDLPKLVRCFLARYGDQARRGSFEVSGDALDKLMRYDWPGNVRELEGLIQRAITLDGRAVLGPDAFALSASAWSEQGENNALVTAKEQVVHQFESAYLINLMARHEGNISKAAKAAGKPRQSLQRLLRKYRIDRAVFLPGATPNRVKTSSAS
jgi:DNA-binding NtrC family response regulator